MISNSRTSADSAYRRMDAFHVCWALLVHDKMLVQAASRLFGSAQSKCQQKDRGSEGINVSIIFNTDLPFGVEAGIV